MGHGPCQSMASPNTRTTFRFTEDVKLILVQDYNLRGLERTIYSDRSTTYQTGLNDTKRGSCFPGGRMEEVISPRASQDGRMVLFLRGYNNKDFLLEGREDASLIIGLSCLSACLSQFVWVTARLYFEASRFMHLLMTRSVLHTDPMIKTAELPTVGPQSSSQYYTAHA
ncbi:hypothetical protein Peur_047478 [Populus x canadensis]